MSELIRSPQVITYAMPDVRVRFAWLLRIGCLTGWAPLAIGVSTTLLWLITRANFLQIVGMWTILCGACATSAGVVCVLVYFFVNRLPDPVLRKAVKEQTVWNVFLNLLNYPVALLCFLVIASV